MDEKSPDVEAIPSDQTQESIAIMDETQARTLTEAWTDLSHPNHYIAYCKSAFWATASYFAVSLGAIISSAGVAAIFGIFLPDAPELLTFIVSSFGTAATIVSFVFLIIVMITETWELIKKIKSGGGGA